MKEEEKGGEKMLAEEEVMPRRSWLAAVLRLPST
jgi:hypothetical protein